SRPGSWRRLRPEEEGAFTGFGLVAAWRVDIPANWHRHPLIDHVVVGINAAFPFSDPVVVALQGVAKDAPHWPHIDPTGNVCLGRLRYSSPAATRILSTLQDALTVLEMTEEEREAEHRREFLSYWAQLGQPTRTPYLSLMGGAKNSRDIAYYKDPRRGVFFAEDATQLNTWLARIGKQPPKVASTTHLIWLDQPLLPDQFPKTGREVIALAGARALEAHVRPGSVLPVLLGCEIDGNSVYVCAEIEGISIKDASKGFRPSKPRPPALVAASFHARPAVRRSVQRADYAWVHGRGKNADIEVLRGKRVAIVGCGALGGFLARALAQAGVGSLLLIDSDELVPSNVGRHVLGMEAVGQDKSPALAKKLGTDFPHAVDFEAWKGAIQNATAEQKMELAACDLVVAAGINLAGELALNQWRQELETPPTLIWTWIEEFAVAGHAVALVDGADLASSLNADGEFQMRLTSDWPAGQGYALEAGCGVAYQPYSAADMMGTINCAHRLCLDVLLGKQRGSIVRSWLGDRDIAAASGCKIDGAFERSFCEISRAWG
ncbi:ThiF family adenylyltransferase, partial [Xanthomonas perforans]